MSESGILEKILDRCSELEGSDVFIQAGAKVYIKTNGKVEQTDIFINGAQAMQMCTHISGGHWTNQKDYDGAYNGEDNRRWRFNIYFQKNKPAIVLRSVDEAPPSLDDLKVPKMIKDMCSLKQGLILIGGATGSGKSTTMAAMINEINTTMHKHIVTIEDPIEYLHRNDKSIISQREVGKDTGSWEAAIKSALRQAPDVVLMGEIRTRESLDMAMKFSETGHLCLGTIHSKTCNETFNRILSLYPEGERESLNMMLSMNVSAFIVQKLIRNKEKKLTAAFEVMMNSPTIKEYVAQGDIRGVIEIMEKSPENEMITMDKYLFSLYKQGIISREATILHAVSKTNLNIMLTEYDATSDDATEERERRISGFSVK